MKIKNLLLVAIFSLLFVSPSFAAESTVNAETPFSPLLVKLKHTPT